MKTNAKIILGVFAGFIVGCAVSMLISSETTEGAGAGDIAKVSKFSKNAVSPAMSAFQEKITSNPEELEKATTSLTVLTSRMTEFDELVNIATTVSEGNEELATSLRNLQSVRQLASNARTSGNQALEALNAIAEGKKSSVDYEQASQNLAIAYMMVDRQINVGKQYVCDVDSFLRGKDVEDYKELALARDLWAGYCAGEAVLTNNDEELAYWSKQQSLLASSTDVLAGFRFVVRAIDVLKQCQEIDSAIGIGFLSNHDGWYDMGIGGYSAIGIDFLSNHYQHDRFNTPALNKDMLSNNEQFNTVVAVNGRELARMNEGISQTFNVDQMMQNVLPDFFFTTAAPSFAKVLIPSLRNLTLGYSQR